MKEKFMESKNLDNGLSFPENNTQYVNIPT